MNVLRRLRPYWAPPFSFTGFPLGGQLALAFGLSLGAVCLGGALGPSWGAADQFLPLILAGACLAALGLRSAPLVWGAMLLGLWQRNIQGGRLWLASLGLLGAALVLGIALRWICSRFRRGSDGGVDAILTAQGQLLWWAEPGSRRLLGRRGAIPGWFGQGAVRAGDSLDAWLPVVLAEDRGPLEAALGAMGRDGCRVDFRVRDEAGGLRVLCLEGRLVPGNGQGPDRLQGSIREVTGTRVREDGGIQRCQERLARLGEALAGQDFGLWEWEVGTDLLTIRESAAAALDEAGPPPQRLALTDWLTGVHGEDRAGVLAGLGRVAQGSAARYVGEFRRANRRGHWSWLRGEGKAVAWDSQGRVIRLAGVFRDVQERRLLEADLEKFSRAMEWGPAPIFITDAQGCFEYCNQAFTRLTGYALEDLLGETPCLLQPAGGDGEGAGGAALWQALLDGAGWQGALVSRRQDGGDLAWHLSLAPLRDGRGELTHFVAMGQESARGEGASPSPGLSHSSGREPVRLS
ncbi:PAS domain-containing protein [Azospira inquinata]|uniref:histidine kinase n=1 Tax=Azospira inquinata TaxID=2785627 RepID=A0A975SJZ8_9RHOO|nr:PAS domain-containing protein [Azospira inquinata]QWT46940.1 PAS domain-containing protein [Azospira inquinata]QWT47736.1 PAS domain-containing protein [Azospira inquinata]